MVIVLCHWRVIMYDIQCEAVMIALTDNTGQKRKALDCFLYIIFIFC